MSSTAPLAGEMSPKGVPSSLDTLFAIGPVFGVAMSVLFYREICMQLVDIERLWSLLMCEEQRRCNVRLWSAIVTAEPR